jgi:hypothetical protein
MDNVQNCGSYRHSMKSSRLVNIHNTRELEVTEGQI